MRHLPVRWLLFPTYLLITLISLVAATAVFLVVLRESSHRQSELRLDTEAQNLAAALASARLEPEPADSLVRVLTADWHTRVTVIDATGRVVAETVTAATAMDNHRDRAEFHEALTLGRGQSTRFSHTLQTTMMYVARALVRDGVVVGAVRTAMPLPTVDALLNPGRTRILLGALAAIVLASLIGLDVSRRVARPIEGLRRGAERFAAGDLAHRVVPAGSGESASLADTFNRMASSLESRIDDLERRNREQAALFAAMTEGVIAVEADERILSVNRAARSLFDVSVDDATGRPIAEVVRNVALVEFVRRSLGSSTVVEGEIVARGDRERVLTAHGSPLVTANGRRVGAIVVLNDVTGQRRREIERRELVASVSHELRTPVTAIKGFLETLRDGALSDPASAQRFVTIALRQTDRLHGLIEDLMRLARLERDIEAKEVTRSVQRIRPLLATAAQTAEAAARTSEVEVVVSCPDTLSAAVNAELLEQAITNLVANAIRYSDPGSRVEVDAEPGDDDTILIHVRDEGCGIDPVHHERLFERFYTVDTGRSRASGGTGLGLAIVKHVARAHGGAVSVESAPRRGSVFTLRLPRGAELSR